MLQTATNEDNLTLFEVVHILDTVLDVFVRATLLASVKDLLHLLELNHVDDHMLKNEAL